MIYTQKPFLFMVLRLGKLMRMIPKSSGHEPRGFLLHAHTAESMAWRHKIRVPVQIRLALQEFFFGVGDSRQVFPV